MQQPLLSPVRKTARRICCSRTTGIRTGLTGLTSLVVAWLPRIGRRFRTVSVTVTQGMLAGIGIVLVAGQLHALVDANAGAAPAPADGLEKLGGFATLLVDAIVSPGAPTAVAVGIGTTAVLVLWPRLRRAARVVPAPLVAFALASAVVTALHLPMARIRVRGLVDLLQPPGGGDFARLGEFGVIGAVLAFALVATAKASRMREGLWWIVVAALLPWVLDLIPVAALAGALVPAGWRLRREEHGKVAVLLVTAGAIVVTNLFDGVVAGLLTAAMMAAVTAAWEISHDLFFEACRGTSCQRQRPRRIVPVHELDEPATPTAVRAPVSGPRPDAVGHGPEPAALFLEFREGCHNAKMP
ncbi:hypothetical protein ACWD4B_35480 [Streptomyces sp. NPDC002536]